MLSNKNKPTRNFLGPCISQTAQMRFDFLYGYRWWVFGVAGEAAEFSISPHLILCLLVLTLSCKFRAHFDGSQFDYHDVKLNNSLILRHNYCKQFHCLSCAVQCYVLADAASVTVHHMNIPFTCCVCVCLKESWHF